MAPRNVKTEGSALARTTKPVKDTTPKSVSASDGLLNVVSGLGGGKDKRSFSVWSQPRRLDRQELENMYRGSWLGKRIVNSIAEDMTADGWRFSFDGESEEMSQTVQKAEKKFSLYAKITEALKWGRLYGGGVIVIGTKDSAHMTEPLDVESLGEGSLRYLHVLDRWRIAPVGVICKDLDSKWFGLPEIYQIAESSVQVHCSRVIRFGGEKLPYFPWVANSYWDDSVLQHVMDSVMNYDASTQSVASMLFEANVDVISGVGISQLLSEKDGEAKLTKRFGIAAMMKSFTHTLLLDSTETYEKKSNNFSGLAQIIQQFTVDVCGASDIPATRLWGQSPAGLNPTGEGEMQNYKKMLGSKQESDLREPLEYLYEIVARSEGFYDEDMELIFLPLTKLSTKDQATVDYQNAQRDDIYMKAGVVPEHVVAKDLKENGTYKNLSDDDINAIEEMGQPPEGGFEQPPVDPNAPPVPPINPADPVDPTAPPFPKADPNEPKPTD